MVLAPEHPLVAALTAPDEAQGGRRRTSRGPQVATEIERLSTDREKTGVADRRRRDQPGQRRADPDLHRRLRPGDVRHRRDHGRAGPRRARLRVRAAVRAADPAGRRARRAPRATRSSEAYVAHADDEVLVNSGEFSGLPADEGGRRIVASLEAARQGQGRGHVPAARLAGQPPALLGHADPGHPLPDARHRAGARGGPAGPAAGHGRLRGRRREPADPRRGVPERRRARSIGEPARRETDTMDTFMDSSWYWYRYLSPDRPDVPIDHDLVETWTPVQLYTGGAEHAVMHHLYGREFTKMIRDLGLVRQNEPWRRVFNQGQILGADGERMSKSRGNVQDPDELVSKYGADTVRLFLMFMGPWDQGGPWSPTGHRWRPPVPEPRLGAGAGPALPGARRSGRGHAARRPGRGGRARGAARRGAPDAARRHRRLRGVPLQHDGREADGADEHAVPLPRLGRSPAARSGTRRSGCCC